MLFASLTGEAGVDGLENIEDQLKAGLQTKAIYQKRKLMADYESLVRQQGDHGRRQCHCQCRWDV